MSINKKPKKFMFRCVQGVIYVGLLVIWNGGAWGADLSLKKAVEMALASNPAILHLAGRYESLLARTRLTRGFYDWSVTISGRYADLEEGRVVVFQPGRIRSTAYELAIEKNYASGTGIDLFANQVKTTDDSSFNLFNPHYETEVGVSLQQSLLKDFIGLPHAAILQADRMRLDALSMDLWREMELLASDVSGLYWDLWMNIQLKDVAVQSEMEAQDFLSETKRLAKVGLREKDEILQAETSWLERREETLTAETLIHNTWNSLRLKIHASDSLEWDTVPTLENPVWEALQSEVDVLKGAFENRSDFLAVQKTVDLQKKLNDSLKGQLLPSLTASGGYSLTGLDPHVGDSWDQVENGSLRGWNIGMVLSHSFGQNTDRASVEGAHAELKRAKAQLETSTNRIEKDVLNTRENFRLNRKLFDLSKEIEKKKGQIERAFTKKYSQGRTSMQDLLRSKEEFRRARYKRRIAESTMAISFMNCLMAKGTYLSSLGYDKSQPLRLLPKEVP